MQSILKVDESLLMSMLLLVFTMLLIVFSFYIERLYTVLDGRVLRFMLLCKLSPGSRQTKLLWSLATTSFNQHFCLLAECFHPGRTQTRNILGSPSSGILERCKKCWDGYFLLLCLMCVVVWHFFSLTETPMIIQRQPITKDSTWQT